MKKVNLLVMSLVSAAALSFTSCSSNDDLAGNAGQEKVDGFYMTLTVQSPNASGTRTVQSNEYNASEALSLMKKLNAGAVNNGVSEMTLEEINSEIEACRKERKKEG